MAGEPDDVDAMVDLQADLKAPLPLADAAFDRVLCHNVLECLPDPGALVAEAVRVLRRHGRLVLAHSDFEPAAPCWWCRPGPGCARPPCCCSARASPHRWRP